MSKFYKALEQAQRDRGLASQGRRADAPASRPAGESPRPAVTRRPVPPRRPELDLRPDGVDDHLVSLVAPAAFEAEQYRALRYLVEQRHKSADLSVIAVSSPAVGDGKTTTAINLAGALAQAPEARVLLVEADLRRPSIAQMLGFPDRGGPGLVTAILDPDVTLDQVVRKRPPFNLNVILAGQTPPSPYEILKLPRLGELLDEARQRYDYVILDTPPLVSVQDCRVIGRWIDGAIVVVAAHRTPRRLVEEALAVLDPAKVLGLVFNGDDPMLSSYDAGSYAGYAAEHSRRGRGGRWPSFGRRGTPSREGRARRRES
jgi:capsular exopolysaccharide synthesis family protein